DYEKEQNHLLDRYHYYRPLGRSYATGCIPGFPDQATVGTRPLGYPDYFAYALIVCKILGVIAIVYPKTPMRLKEWAYAGLSFNLIFAFISHAFVDKNIGFMLMPLIFLGILAVSYIYYHIIRKHKDTNLV